MDRTKAGKEIMALFIQAAQRYHGLEKIPTRSGTKHDLYHSERHMLDRIAEHPDINVTEFAQAVGITKGAVSQVVKKLEAKSLVKRYKGNSNDKEVFLALTKAGRDVCLLHGKKNEETLGPLLRELKKYPDDKVEFLIAMLGWISDHLDESAKQMKGKR